MDKSSEITINEIEAKAAVYDYVMSNILSENFENIAATAGDVLKIIMDIGK